MQEGGAAFGKAQFSFATEQIGVLQTIIAKTGFSTVLCRECAAREIYKGARKWRLC